MSALFDRQGILERCCDLEDGVELRVRVGIPEDAVEVLAVDLRSSGELHLCSGRGDAGLIEELHEPHRGEGIDADEPEAEAGEQVEQLACGDPEGGGAEQALELLVIDRSVARGVFSREAEAIDPCSHGAEEVYGLHRLTVAEGGGGVYARAREGAYTRVGGRSRVISGSSTGDRRGDLGRFTGDGSNVSGLT